ncbi:hypothetical protein RMR16_005740 [Agrobacterium sp. rho-13.3]|uniref:hypothetical protein n=1 Tax=Agrobacterium sp. rho-13.3 TaxID=3072980 RepID=UPI003D78D2A8
MSALLTVPTQNNRVEKSARPKKNAKREPVANSIKCSILSASDTIHKPLGNAITLKLAGEKSGGACRTKLWHAIKEFSRV